MPALDAYDWYLSDVAKAEEARPELPDKFCECCIVILVRGSYNYDAGRHIDGCE